MTSLDKYMCYNAINSNKKVIRKKGKRSLFIIVGIKYTWAKFLGFLQKIYWF